MTTSLGDSVVGGGEDGRGSGGSREGSVEMKLQSGIEVGTGDE